MKIERESQSQQNYGTLSMRAYDVGGNKINAFYDSENNLVFVLDNTVSESKPNVLLVINPDADKKWDEILSRDYGVDLETIRPKQDNKYQKLDIEYSGLNVYNNLISAYLANEDIEDYLEQLNVLRDSAVRHSAMARLSAANEIISKTNVTIVKTKESIVDLQNRIKTLRGRLAETKQGIGKVPTKQSAAKILKLESQIEALTEKSKRAKKRLESAQRRLEVATSDAEIASDILNMPETEIKKNKPVMVAPKYELEPVNQDDDDNDDVDTQIETLDDEAEEESDVKPLFEEDPQILDEEIAFKPIEFDIPAGDENTNENVPMLNNDMFNAGIDEDGIESDESDEDLPDVDVSQEPELENKPVIDTIKPVVEQPVVVAENVETPEQSEPVSPIVPPVPAPSGLPQSPLRIAAPETPSAKPTFIYYMLLGILIALSVFTLWLYQRSIKSAAPILTAKTSETVVVDTPKAKVAVAPVVVEEPKITEESSDDDFLEDVAIETPVEELVPEPQDVIEYDQPVVEESVFTEEPVIEEPEIAVPEDTAITEEYDEDVVPETTEEIVEEVIEQDVEPNKPVYEVANKYDDMFIDESANEQPSEYENEMFYEE